MAKKRADRHLVESGLADSREQAQRLIMAGKVFVDGKRVEKAASPIDESGHLTIAADDSYVSRGGLKLEKALHEFSIDARGRFAVDIGASTGGFTDCLLRHGAASVVAIDVGYGQLAWSLRNDPRVIVMERTNIRHVTPERIPRPADVITIDVSFISLQKIVENVKAVLAPGGELVALVKPQFEAGRERVGKKGVVRDSAVHKDVLDEVWRSFEDAGFVIRGLTYSPLKGPEGNIEFLLHARLGGEPAPAAERSAGIDAVVEEAHRTLD